ncbi:MAG: hypothetical protein ACRCTE_07540 [Cellulosilyticaceae bacterium]
MLAKNYHYDYYCTVLFMAYDTTTHDRRKLRKFDTVSTYPISNGKEIIDAIADMGNVVLTILKNQGLDIKDYKNDAVNEILKKYLVQTLSNVKLQMIGEDGYKYTFVQNNKGLKYFDLKGIHKYDPYQNKLTATKPYLLSGVDLSQILPELWMPQWIVLSNV